MIDYRGLKLPDGETHLQKIMHSEKGKTDFMGKPTYQFRKFKAAFQYCDRYQNALDIGAHVGLWSRVMVRFFNHIDCFEPIKEFRQIFEHNIERADRERITLHPFALGTKAKDEVFMTRRREMSGGAHILDDGVNESVTDTVHMRTLDSFNLGTVDFIKIDCEGAELGVLQGGEKTIRDSKPVMIVEQKPGNIKRYGQQGRPAAVELLQSWGAQELTAAIGDDYIMGWPK